VPPAAPAWMVLIRRQRPPRQRPTHRLWRDGRARRNSSAAIARFRLTLVVDGHPRPIAEWETVGNHPALRDLGPRQHVAD
jgi:hypothetical protein